MQANKQKIKKFRKSLRKGRTQAVIFGTSSKPRASVTKSLSHVFVQLIDDEGKNTLVSLHSKKLSTKGNKTEKARELGKEVAKLAVDKGIKKCVFDRGANRYHGRVKAVAEGMREGGLEF